MARGNEGQEARIAGFERVVLGVWRWVVKHNYPKKFIKSVFFYLFFIFIFFFNLLIKFLEKNVH
jgi:hypothetical protein